jgi:UDPglucose 6-dehydrogenase
VADFTDTPDLPDFALCDDALSTAEGADALVLLTEWPALRALDLEDVAQRMRRPVLLDTRDFFDRAEAGRAGLRYLGMSSGPARAAAAATVGAGMPA